MNLLKKNTIIFSDFIYKIRSVTNLISRGGVLALFLFCFVAQSQANVIEYKLLWDEVGTKPLLYMPSGQTVRLFWDAKVNSQYDYYKLLISGPNGQIIAENHIYHTTREYYFDIACSDGPFKGEIMLTAVEKTPRTWPYSGYNYRHVAYGANDVMYFTGNPLVEPIGETQCESNPITICFPDQVKLDITGLGTGTGGSTPTITVPEWRKFTWRSFTQNKIVATGLCYTPSELDYANVAGTTLKAAVYTVTVDPQNNIGNQDGCSEREQAVTVVVLDVSSITDIPFGTGCEVKNDGPSYSCTLPGSYCVLPMIEIPSSLNFLSVEQEWKHIDKSTGNLNENNMSDGPNQGSKKVCYSHVAPEEYEDYRFIYSLRGGTEIKNINLTINCNGSSDYRVSAGLGYICDVVTVQPGGPSLNTYKLDGDPNEPNHSNFAYQWDPIIGLSNPQSHSTTFTPDPLFCGTRRYTLEKTPASNSGPGYLVYCVDIVGPSCKKSEKKSEDSEMDLSKKTYSSPEISIYPNPTNGIITINPSGGLSYMDITVTDLAGKTVCQLSIREIIYPIQLDLSELKNGYYNLTLVSPEIVKNKTIVKY